MEARILGSYFDGFVAFLLREGYKPQSVKKKYDLAMVAACRFSYLVRDSRIAAGSPGSDRL